MSARRQRRKDGGEAAFEAIHDDVAEAVFATLGEMKGAAMKIGQMLSFVDLDIDPELNNVYQRKLAALCDAAPPSDAGEIAAVLEGEYGAPVDRVFAWWDPQPLAVASIGQVHRARLPTGEDVVLKVQHPGVAEAVEADLSNVELLGPIAKLINPKLDAKPILAELRERVVEELDYQQEAAYQQAFFDRYQNHPFIVVPEVHTEYSRPRVLCSTFIEGQRFEPMMSRATTADRDIYGEIIFRFVFGSLYRFRMFNSDPHPGNFLFPGDGTVAFIDYGSCRVFSTEARTRLREVHRAVAADDSDRLGPALAEAGILPPESDPDLAVVLGWFRLAYEPMAADAPYTYNSGYARRLAASSSDPNSPYITNLRKLQMPPEYLLLNRIQFGVNSLLARLGPTANWQRIMHELYEGDEPTTPLGVDERRGSTVTHWLHRAGVVRLARPPTLAPARREQLAEPQDKTVFLDGPVHYLDFGGMGTGTPIVCIHGLGGSYQNWLAVGPLLARGHRVLALDLAGFGLTPPAGRSSHVRAHRRLVSAFIREVVGKPVILMGNSMGGLISLLQAEAEPASVRGLVLVNPAVPIKGVRFEAVIVKDFLAYLLPGVGERVLRTRSRRLTPAEQVARTMGIVAVDPGRMDPAIMAQAEELALRRRQFDWVVPAFLESARSLLRMNANTLAHRRRLAAITAPALIVHGLHDRLVSVAAVEELVRLRPDWQLNVLDDVGHVPQLEAPEDVVDIIQSWLRNLASVNGIDEPAITGGSA